MNTEESCKGPNPEHLEVDNVPRTWGNPIQIPRCAEDTDKILASTPERTFLDPETTAMVWNVANTMFKKNKKGYDGRLHPEDLLFVLHAATIMEGTCGQARQIVRGPGHLGGTGGCTMPSSCFTRRCATMADQITMPQRIAPTVRELVFQLVDALKTITLLAPNVLALGRLPTSCHAPAASGRCRRGLWLRKRSVTRLAIFADEEGHVKDGSAKRPDLRRLTVPSGSARHDPHPRRADPTAVGQDLRQATTTPSTWWPNFVAWPSRASACCPNSLLATLRRLRIQVLSSHAVFKLVDGHQSI